MAERIDMIFSLDYALPPIPEVTKANPYGTREFGPQPFCLPDGGEFVRVTVSPHSIKLDFVNERMTFQADRELPSWGHLFVRMRMYEREDRFPRSRSVHVSVTVIDDDGMLCYAGAHASSHNSPLSLHLEFAADRMKLVMSDPSWMA